MSLATVEALKLPIHDPTQSALALNPPHQAPQVLQEGIRSSQHAQSGGNTPRFKKSSSRADKKPSSQLATVSGTITTPSDPWPRPYYFLGDGLRRVRPYHYTYNTYCKERWRDREVLDVFAEEFRDRPVDYYRSAIEKGLIHINSTPITSIHTKVKNGDLLSHTLHRHEPPVSDAPIETVHEDDDMIVISKPAGVPVHPTGRYNYNSVTEIMRADRAEKIASQPALVEDAESTRNDQEREQEAVEANGTSTSDQEKPKAAPKSGTMSTRRAARQARHSRNIPNSPHQWHPLPCNRLDRLTSGIMFVGRHPAAANTLMRKLKSRTILKEYVARVVGEFPERASDGAGEIICEEPILQISPKLGLNRVRQEGGKEARTVFRRVAYYPPTQNADTEKETGTKARGYSIVSCLPLTGRTHQIRVHLQYLGHPISNDPIYSNRRVFGASLARGDSTAANDEGIMAKLARMGKSSPARSADYDEDAPSNHHTDSPRGHHSYFTTPTHTPTSQSELATITTALSQSQAARKAERLTGDVCPVCEAELYSDPGPHELEIYLHARRYADVHGAWEYETEIPAWALPPGAKAEEDGEELKRRFGEAKVEETRRFVEDLKRAEQEGQEGDGRGRQT